MGLVDSSFESYRECVECGLPSHRPACSAAACGVECSGGEVEALQRGRVVGEVPSRADSAAIAGVDRLDRVGAADHAPDLDVVVRNGMNSLQAFSQSLLIAGYCLPHLALNSAKRSRAAASDGAV